MRVTPQSAGCDCASCPFGKHGKPHRPVLAVGPSRPRAVVVAESPGGEEVDQGAPLVGATGKEFNATLEGVGLKRETLLLLNTMCCRPLMSRTEGDMARAIRACRPYVAAVLSSIDESVPMLIAGKWAFYSITGHDAGYANERGFVQRNIGPSTVSLTLHIAQQSAELGISDDTDDADVADDD